MSKTLSVVMGVLFIGTLVVTLNTSAVAFDGRGFNQGYSHGYFHVYHGYGGYGRFGHGPYGYGPSGFGSGVIAGDPSRVTGGINGNDPDWW